jgi:hypothetical protein
MLGLEESPASEKGTSAGTYIKESPNCLVFGDSLFEADSVLDFAAAEQTDLIVVCLKRGGGQLLILRGAAPTGF